MIKIKKGLIIRIIIIMLVSFLYLNSSYSLPDSSTLRPRLQCDGLVKKDKMPAERTFIGLIREDFSQYVTQDLPIKILDVGAAVFSFRVRKILNDNGIKAEVDGVAPDIRDDVVKKAGREGIRLMRTDVETLRYDEHEKERYQIIIINEPYIIIDVDGFFEVLDYLLAPDGVIILRPDAGIGNGDFKENVEMCLMDIGKWKIENLGVDMKDLPRKGSAPPLLIRKKSHFTEQPLVPALPSGQNSSWINL